MASKQIKPKQKTSPPSKDPFSHPNLKGLKGEKLVQQLVLNDLAFYQGQTFPERPTKREQMYMDKRITELELAAGGDGEYFSQNSAKDPQELRSNLLGNDGPNNSDDELESIYSEDDDRANDIDWSRDFEKRNDDNDNDNDDDDDPVNPVKGKVSSKASSSSAPVSSSSILSSDETPSIPFIQSEVFKGSKQGYVFTTGPQGTGYYLDKVAQKASERSGSAGNASKSQPPSENNITSDEKGTPGSTFTLIIVSFALLVRASLALWGYSGEAKPPMFGDFEAQRHWLEITTNLPLSDWYRSTKDNDLLYWGLDYPPLTAFFSYFFGRIARLLVPELVELEVSRGIETMPTKAFMRASVLACDVFITIPSLLWLANYYIKYLRQSSNLTTKSVGYRTQEVCFRLSVLLSPALLLIDHGHFQYNGVSIGFTLLAALFILQDKDVLGSIFFCLALNYKQMTLYYSLVIFIVLLRKIWIQPSFVGKVVKLAQIGSSVIATFAVMWLPFCLSVPSTPDGSAASWQDTCLPSMLAVLQRCFPFSRGIFEDKVSNLWYSMSVVYDFRGKIPVETVIRASMVLTLVMSAPILAVLFKRKITFERILLGLTGGSLAFFLASFQVHEKSILMVLVPASLLTLVENGPDDGAVKGNDRTFSRMFWWLLAGETSSYFTLWLQFIGTWTLFPLLVKDGLRIPYSVLKSLYFFFAWLVVYFRQSRQPGSSASGSAAAASSSLLYLPRWFNRLLLPLSMAGMLVLHAGEALIVPPVRFPDLFPALFALFGCANLVIAYLVIVYWLICAPEPLSGNAGNGLRDGDMVSAKNGANKKQD